MYDEESTFYQWDIGVLLDWLRVVGPDRTQLGSDLGQQNNPLPVESYRKVLGRLLEAGVSEPDLRRMVTTNPARLLGLDD
jgi:predicted TIM-barrel fold metal-dependent hydrolase